MNALDPNALCNRLDAVWWEVQSAANLLRLHCQLLREEAILSDVHADLMRAADRILALKGDVLEGSNYGK